MTLDRFLSASLAGSSVSLNFKNWHHRICGDSDVSSQAWAPMAGARPRPRRQAHLNLLEAGRELALLEGGGVVPDPLQQQQHQLPVLLPAQLQLLRASRGCQGVGPSGCIPTPYPGPPAPTHVGLHPVLHVGHAGHGVVQGRDVCDDGLLVGLGEVHVCGGEGSEGPHRQREGRRERQGQRHAPSGSRSRVTPSSRSATEKAWSRFSRLAWAYTLFMSMSIGLQAEWPVGRAGRNGGSNAQGAPTYPTGSPSPTRTQKNALSTLLVPSFAHTDSPLHFGPRAQC